jgi:hypothetical protein
VTELAAFHGSALPCERMTDKPWLFKFGYPSDIFLKMDKECLLLQGKQLTLFVANDKM